MKSFAALAALIIFASGCQLMRGRTEAPEKQDKPVVEQERKPDAPAEEKKPEAKKPAPDPRPAYKPPDFPSSGGLGGDFHRGDARPGFDAYRSPNATSPNRGYTFGIGPHHDVKIKVEKVKKVEGEKKPVIKKEIKPGIEK